MHLSSPLTCVTRFHRVKHECALLKLWRVHFQQSNQGYSVTTEIRFHYIQTAHFSTTSYLSSFPVKAKGLVCPGHCPWTLLPNCSQTVATSPSDPCSQPHLPSHPYPHGPLPTILLYTTFYLLTYHSRFRLCRQLMSSLSPPATSLERQLHEARHFCLCCLPVCPLA